MKNLLYSLLAVVSLASGAFAQASYDAGIDLTAVGTEGKTAIGTGATAALPIFGTFVVLAVLIGAFQLLKRKK